jgi:multidrug transporter EmrE-like cation transporter
VISTPVALLVLVSALLHTGWNCLVKAGADRLLDTLAITLGASLLAASLLPFAPLPAPEAWPWLGLTVLLHVGYFAALVQSYRHADLSVAYPLMRGTAPLLVALAAPLLDEPLTPGLLAGVLFIGGGIALPVGVGFARGAVTCRRLAMRWSTPCSSRPIRSATASVCALPATRFPTRCGCSSSTRSPSCCSRAGGAGSAFCTVSSPAGARSWRAR